VNIIEVESNMNYSLYYILIIAIFLSCACNKAITEDPPIIEEFYYDEPNFSLVKIYPKNDPEIVLKYLQSVNEDSVKPYTFYKKNILQIDEINEGFDDSDYDRIVKPKLIDRPDSPDYPLDAPIVGGFLMVVVTVHIDTNGYVEFAELYNIYREDILNTEKDKELSRKNIKPWTETEISKFDKPFIKLSLFSATEAIFKPATIDSKSLRVKMNIPYRYVFSEKYDK
jgi:hypothetical protein